MILDEVHWTRVIKKSTYFIFTLLCIFIIFKLAIFYMPFLIAFIISLIIEPLIKFIMKKLNFTRRTSSIIVFIIAFGIIIGVLVLGTLTLISESTKLLEVLNNYFDTAYRLIENLISGFKYDNIKLPNEIMIIIQDSIEGILNYISNWIKNILTSLVNILTSIPTITIYFIITIISLYFICTDKIYILDQMEHHFPRKWSKKILIHIKEIAATLGSYLKAQAILILISFN